MALCFARGKYANTYFPKPLQDGFVYCSVDPSCTLDVDLVIGPTTTTSISSSPGHYRSSMSSLLPSGRAQTTKAPQPVGRNDGT